MWNSHKPHKLQSTHGRTGLPYLGMNSRKSYLPPTIELPQFPLFLVKAAGSHVAVCVECTVERRSVSLPTVTLKPWPPHAGKHHSSSDSRRAARSDWASPHTLRACGAVADWLWLCVRRASETLPSHTHSLVGVAPPRASYPSPPLQPAVTTLRFRPSIRGWLFWSHTSCFDEQVRFPWTVTSHLAAATC